MKYLKSVYLGIDWGTHSSKWAADVLTGHDKHIPVNGIIKSDLLFFDNKILINPPDSLMPELDRVISLKRNIIKDPFSPFWSEREDIGMPMGAGVAFSVCSLMGDFLSYLSKEEITIKDDTAIEIGFSFPNWLKSDRASKKAVANYQEAILLSCYLYEFCKDKLPRPGLPYSVSEWNEVIKEARSYLALPTESKILISDMTTNKYTINEFSSKKSSFNCSWRYLVESCAAGLPYLRNIKLKYPPGLPGLGKLLVIDIGAGSTDIGYMLRAVNRESHKENLFYFPPAPTLDVAGNSLTEDIKSFQESMGKPITFVEADVFKITKYDEWIDKPFAELWRKQISRHVKEYVRNVTDQRWLNVNVDLQVIITGGSGIVAGLSEELKKAIVEGLEQRRVDPIIQKKVVLVDQGEASTWKFSEKELYARMAVAIGCSDSDKPSLKYLSKMDPVTRVETHIEKY